MAKAKQTDGGPDRIAVPPPQFRRLRLHVRGISPYYSNAGAAEAARAMEEDHAMSPEDLKQRKQDKRQNKLPPRDPAAEFKRSLRPMGRNGKYGIPAAAFKDAFLEAGQKRGQFKTVLSQAVFVIGPLVEIRKSKPRPVARTGKLQKKVPYEIYQMLFEGWEADLEVDFDEALIDANSVCNLFGVAGNSIGVGGFRPQKSGDCGRFEVSVSRPARGARKG